MKLDFGEKAMDIGTSTFNFVRALMVAQTGGAELNDCLVAAQRIKDRDIESWIREWAILADKASQAAGKAMEAGQTITARQAYLRASNYYRTVMSAIPCTEKGFDRYLSLSRESFHKAAKLFSPQIEVVDIPLGSARMPAYFLSAGSSKRPTLVVVNGGDSTNEEMVHWAGFAALERGWNCLVFEGPGQMSALQLNPGLPLRPDWEVPVKAVVDYAISRYDVDQDKIALYGPSLGSLLAARAAAYEKRLCACICQGLVVDVYEAWHGIWPEWLQKAKPGTFDRLFGVLEKASPQVHKLASIFRRMHGVSSASEMIEAWRPFSVKELGSKIECPLLLLYGEAEYAEQQNGPLVKSIAHFMSGLGCPSFIHEFAFEEGWAATHCQVGASSAFQAVLFDWLDKVVIKKDFSQKSKFSMDLILKHYGNDKDLVASFKNVRLGSV